MTILVSVKHNNNNYYNHYNNYNFIKFLKIYIYKHYLIN